MTNGIDLTDLPPTTQQFYEDGYQVHTQAWLDAVGTNDKGQPVAICSGTTFYPQGGGQRGDRGRIILPASLGEQIPAHLDVIDTRKSGVHIMHLLGGDPPMDVLRRHVVGAAMVDLEVDWNFRHRQMRLHSTAHLLHCFMERAMGHRIDTPQLSDLQETRGINRYDNPDLITADELVAALEELNRFIPENHSIATSADIAPDRPTWARKWECEAWEIPCGGIHPKGSAEIGRVEATMSSKKGQTTIAFTVLD